MAGKERERVLRENHRSWFLDLLSRDQSKLADTLLEQALQRKSFRGGVGRYRKILTQNGGKLPTSSDIDTEVATEVQTRIILVADVLPVALRPHWPSVIPLVTEAIIVPEHYAVAGIGPIDALVSATLRRGADQPWLHHHGFTREQHRAELDQTARLMVQYRYLGEASKNGKDLVYLARDADPMLEYAYKRDRW